MNAVFNSLGVALRSVEAKLLLAWGGLWVHEVHRVPLSLGLTPDATIPFLALLIALEVWLRRSSYRGPARTAAAAYGWIQGVGGMMSALPLPFLPFVPAQTVDHYLAHLAYALAQIPLILWAQTRSPHDSKPAEPSRRSVHTARLNGPLEPRAQRSVPLPIPAVLIMGAVITFFAGTAWDIQWHVAVGRDRAFTVPHVVMLVSIALVGLTSLVAVLARAWPIRRVGFVRSIIGACQASPGQTLSGFGAMLAAISFPLDDYWHALYGIDVSLAPFHVMIISGMGMAGIGATIEAVAALRRTGGVVAQLSVGAALAGTLCVYLLLITETQGRSGVAFVGGLPVALYPILAGLAVPITSVCATLLLGPRGGLLVASLVLVMRQALLRLVPLATAAVSAAQSLQFRPNAPQIAVAPQAVPSGSLMLTSAAVGIAAWWARRTGKPVALTAGCVAVFATATSLLIDRPWTSLVPVFFPGVDLKLAALLALPSSAAAAAVGALLGIGLARVVEPRLTRTQPIWRPRTLLPALRSAAGMAVLLGVLETVPAFAHDAAPLSSAQTRLGPYVIEVSYYTQPAGGRELSFEVAPLASSAAPSHYEVTAVPGPTTNAVPVRARMVEVDPQGHAAGTVNLPVSGNWLLEINVNGPLGSASGDAAVLAEPPATAMPGPVAWGIGLAPVWGILAFARARLAGSAGNRVIAGRVSTM